MAEYSLAFKRKALLTLQDNNFNLSETARVLKVSRTTLIKWRSLYGGDVYDDPTEKDEIMRRQAELAMAQGAETKQLAEKLVHKTLKKLIERIEEDPDKISTGNLAYITKEIIPYILPKFDGKDDGIAKNMEHTYAVFMQNLYVEQNHYNNDTEEQKVITVKGDPA